MDARGVVAATFELERSTEICGAQVPQGDAEFGVVLFEPNGQVRWVWADPALQVSHIAIADATIYVVGEPSDRRSAVLVALEASNGHVRFSIPIRATRGTGVHALITLDGGDALLAGWFLGELTIRDRTLRGHADEEINEEDGFLIRVGARSEVAMPVAMRTGASSNGVRTAGGAALPLFALAESGISLVDANGLERRQVHITYSIHNPQAIAVGRSGTLAAVLTLVGRAEVAGHELAGEGEDRPYVVVATWSADGAPRGVTQLPCNGKCRAHGIVANGDRFYVAGEGEGGVAIGKVASTDRVDRPFAVAVDENAAIVGSLRITTAEPFVSEPMMAGSDVGWALSTYSSAALEIEGEKLPPGTSFILFQPTPTR